jgi:thioesterase domain-containing protein
MASRYRKRGASLPANLRYAQIEAAHLSALAGHAFMPYAGNLMLLRAMNRGYEGVVSLSEAEDPTLGWGGIVRGKLEIRNVPANHLNMLLEPNVREVARVLMEAASDRQASVAAVR